MTMNWYPTFDDVMRNDRHDITVPFAKWPHSIIARFRAESRDQEMDDYYRVLGRLMWCGAKVGNYSDEIIYREYHLHRDHTQWHYVHQDYDGAPDSCDNRCGARAYLEDVLDEIDEQIAEAETA